MRVAIPPQAVPSGLDPARVLARICASTRDPERARHALNNVVIVPLRLHGNLLGFAPQRSKLWFAGRLLTFGKDVPADAELSSMERVMIETAPGRALEMGVIGPAYARIDSRRFVESVAERLGLAARPPFPVFNQTVMDAGTAHEPQAEAYMMAQIRAGRLQRWGVPPEAFIIELGSVVHRALPFIAASPDGAIVVREGSCLRVIGACEYKLSRAVRGNSSGVCQIPEAYQTQMLAQSGVLGGVPCFFLARSYDIGAPEVAGSEAPRITPADWTVGDGEPVTCVMPYNDALWRAQVDALAMAMANYIDVALLHPEIGQRIVAGLEEAAAATPCAPLVVDRHGGARDEGPHTLVHAGSLAPVEWALPVTEGDVRGTCASPDIDYTGRGTLLSTSNGGRVLYSAAHPMAAQIGMLPFVGDQLSIYDARSDCDIRTVEPLPSMLPRVHTLDEWMIDAS